MKRANLLDIVLSGVFATSQEIEQEIEDVSRGGEAENEALNTAEIEDGSSDNEADQDVDQEIENYTTVALQAIRVEIARKIVKSFRTLPISF